MINEGGKWAHVVLRKCVFEPKAAGISSLMHQPSTGHLRSTVCCAVSSVPVERRCIDSPKTPSLSSCFSFYPVLLLSFMSFFVFLGLSSHLLCFHLIITFFLLHFLVSAISVASSVFLFFPYCLSSLH